MTIETSKVSRVLSFIGRETWSRNNRESASFERLNFLGKSNFLGEKTHVATFSFTCENDETKSVSAFLAPLVWLQNLRCSFDKKKKKKFTHARKMVSL